jgi:hypothetical protein
LGFVSLEQFNINKVEETGREAAGDNAVIRADSLCIHAINKPVNQAERHRFKVMSPSFYCVPKEKHTKVSIRAMFRSKDQCSISPYSATFFESPVSVKIPESYWVQSYEDVSGNPKTIRRRSIWSLANLFGRGFLNETPEAAVPLSHSHQSSLYVSEYMNGSTIIEMYY